MAKSESNRITSCTISGENTEDILSVVTKVLQTEIHVRLYNSGSLISGRIWPMSEQQKDELYSILYQCIDDWDCDDYSVDKTYCMPKSCLNYRKPRRLDDKYRELKRVQMKQYNMQR